MLARPDFAWPGDCAVHIVARDIRRRDAVGEFCLQLADLLSDNGVTARLLAENWDAGETPWVRPVSALPDLVASRDLIFFHFSTEDPALPVVAALHCRKLLYFHGITPPEFFEDDDPEAAARVRAGLAQMAWAGRFDLLMCNSVATASALCAGLGDGVLEEIAICPPVLGIGRRGGRSDAPAAPPGDTLILFVGRLAPHKSVHNLLAAFHVLAADDRQARLVIVGHPATPSYDAACRTLANAAGPDIGGRIVFMRDLDVDALRRLYATATLFVTLSAHEGFCVPVLEAMQFGLPVLAGPDPAIGALLGGVGCLPDADPVAVAGALARGLGDSAWRDDIRVRQQARFPTLAAETDGRIIWQALERLLRHDARSV